MIQAIAGDETRGETRESFDHIRALFETLGEEELTDYDLPADRLMYRLFHEDGVRLSALKGVFQAVPLFAGARRGPGAVVLGRRAE